jgi:hypothetical protein
MERDFYNDEFEELIKLKADQYRMYPSDKVWKGIKRSLHSDKRRYWFGFALLLTGLSYFGIDQLIVSPPAKGVTNQGPARNTVTEKHHANIVPFNQVTPDRSPAVITPSPLDRQPQQQEIVEKTGSVLIPMSKNESLAPTIVPENADVILVAPALAVAVPNIKQSPVLGLDKPLTAILIPSLVSDQPATQKEEDIAKDEDNTKINWLQEYAVYDLSPFRPQRVSWQISFAPTMNYRKLTGRNDAKMQSSARNIPIALSIEGDLDKLVNHKPALGFELGSYVVYSLSHNLALKGGLQFNYSRYEIQAYSSATERATIALNSINGLSSPSITNLTQLRNFGGYAVQEIQNQYFQLSVPLGVEINLLGSKKLQLGVAGTVQPTYLLNRNTYLISSDYKNYTKEPSLVRRWNVNTSAETFVSYKTAGLKWQVGPQIRYQLFSSYADKYPIKEYLIEYGVKIGVTKTIR